MALTNKKTIMLTAALMMGAMTALPGCSTLKERAEQADAARETNPGPCPRAFSLYEASRKVEFAGAESFASVGFTGEIDQVRSLCRYFSDSPITADLEIDMAFGRGPAAQGETLQFNYFVSVTRKNIDVIKKEYFPVSVTFAPGQDMAFVTERLDGIVIPRAKESTSGANFEIIVGFEVTPQQAAFNEAGKRFRISAGN